MIKIIDETTHMHNLEIQTITNIKDLNQQLEIEAKMLAVVKAYLNGNHISDNYLIEELNHQIIVSDVYNMVTLIIELENNHIIDYSHY